MLKFSYPLVLTYIWVLIERVLLSNDNICFVEKFRNTLISMRICVFTKSIFKKKAIKIDLVG